MRIILTVDQGPDSADYYIGNNAVKGDIVLHKIMDLQL